MAGCYYCGKVIYRPDQADLCVLHYSKYLDRCRSVYKWLGHSSLICSFPTFSTHHITVIGAFKYVYRVPMNYFLAVRIRPATKNDYLKVGLSPDFRNAIEELDLPDE